MPQPSGYDDAREAIETHFRDAWLALSAPNGPAPVEMDNLRFSNLDARDGPWGRFVIIEGRGTQIGLGDWPCTRFGGQFVLQIRVPEKEGSSVARTLGDQFLDLWKDATTGKALVVAAVGDSGTIRTEHGYMARDGVDEGWFQMRGIVPFVRDIRRT